MTSAAHLIVVGDEQHLGGADHLVEATQPGSGTSEPGQPGSWTTVALPTLAYRPGVQVRTMI